MAKTVTTPKRAFGKLLTAVAIAAALCATSAAQAGVLDFEAPVDSTLVFGGDVLTIGEYRLEGLGDGMVGALTTADSCATSQCPVNNNTTFYTGLDDGYFVFGKTDNSLFKVSNLSASFVGAGMGPYPALSGVLLVRGINAGNIVAETWLELDGPVNGNFNFAKYNMGRFGDYEFTDVLIAGFTCDADGNCGRGTNQANFAVDNITTYVPEPGSFALMGLGLLGLGAFSRRRAA